MYYAMGMIFFTFFAKTMCPIKMDVILHLKLTHSELEAVAHPPRILRFKFHIYFKQIDTMYVAAAKRRCRFGKF